MLKQIKIKIKNRLKAWQIEKELKASFRKNKINATKSFVYFDLRDKRIENYYFPLIFFFHEAGYQIFLENKNRFLSSFYKYNKYLKLLDNIVLDRPKQDEKTIFITDQKPKENDKYFRSIKLNLNVFSRNKLNEPYFLFPYPMHPQVYGERYFDRINEFRNIEKKTGVFFSGNTFKEAYHHPIFKDFFKILDRHEVLKVLDEELSEKETFIIQQKGDLQKFFANKYLDKFVRTDWEWSPQKSRNLDIRIPNDKWLKTLAQSNFFLATPGIRMPMCHNVIEAMSVGSIPILQYPKDFDPNLEHLKNCLFFDSKKDLVQKVRYALQMDKEQISEIRQNVLTYYDSFHTPKAFVKTIENQQEQNIVLYLYAEHISIIEYQQSCIN